MPDRRPARPTKRAERPAGGAYARRDRPGAAVSPRRRGGLTTGDACIAQDDIGGKDTRDDPGDAPPVRGRSRSHGKLIVRYIEPHPRFSGVEEAWVREAGVPVWALVGHFAAVGRRVEQVAEDYDLPREAVEAALAYYRRHRPAIDARLAANGVPAI